MAGEKAMKLSPNPLKFARATANLAMRLSLSKCYEYLTEVGTQSPEHALKLLACLAVLDNIKKTSMLCLIATSMPYIVATYIYETI